MRLDPDSDGPTGGCAHKRTNIELTNAEFAVYTAIEDLLLENGYAPTLREIAERVGWRSTGSVSQYLDRLRAHGVIEGRGRSLRVWS